MDQSLADRSDGEEVVDTKLGSVPSTDSRLQPSNLSLQCMILLNLEQIDGHTWNKV